MSEQIFYRVRINPEYCPVEGVRAWGETTIHKFIEAVLDPASMNVDHHNDLIAILNEDEYFLLKLGHGEKFVEVNKIRIFDAEPRSDGL